ncbi:hypothetical protein ACIGZJ_14525 [Kitasatospora sp. NPDC052868]|uniref:hypothetical protein n=1 Tax=Kitasatospora sp. NPDC052868 TaxID=3364060 RepID=UPI0037CBF93F
MGWVLKLADGRHTESLGTAVVEESNLVGAAELPVHNDAELEVSALRVCEDEKLGRHDGRALAWVIPQTSRTSRLVVPRSRSSAFLPNPVAFGRSGLVTPGAPAAAAGAVPE